MPVHLKTNGMISRLMESAFCFRKSSAEKITFILLNQVDLILTVFAFSHGLSEVNPLMRNLFAVPYQFLVVKTGIPIFFAWMVPGKLLIPAIILLALVVGWDIKELVVFYF